MAWLTNTLGSAIGKKLMMAVTGLGFIGFLKVHLAGNLNLYGGKDAFNSYAERLHALGPLVTVFEVGLLTLALIHVLTGLILYLGNWRARPTRYIVSASAGGRTLGSRTMPYTGLIILLFVVYHLSNFHFVDKTGTTIYSIVQGAFKNPVTVAIYIVAMVAVAIHVNHGFWSLFQTIGANHPKYMPAIRLIGLLLSLGFGIGFGFLPIYVALMA